MPKTKKKKASIKKFAKKVVKKSAKSVVKKPKSVKKPATKKRVNKKLTAKKAAKKSKKSNKMKKSKKVSTVAEGYHSITPYLIVHNAQEAIEFYKNAFGAIEVMRIVKEGEKVGHAELQIGGSKFMLADAYPELNAISAKEIGNTPVSLYLYIDDVDAVVEKAVQLGATLLRDVETMYYGDRSGGVEDPFGHRWYIATHVEDVSPEEINRRLAALEKAREAQG